jgi:uncharacterized protein with FMN-binding domain
MTMEEKLTLLEKQMYDLTRRVNVLEYASMQKANKPSFTPGTLPEPVIYAQGTDVNPVAEASEATWPFPPGARP